MLDFVIFQMICDKKTCQNVWDLYQTAHSVVLWLPKAERNIKKQGEKYHVMGSKIG